jgi:hypothetical protein
METIEHLTERHYLRGLGIEYNIKVNLTDFSMASLTTLFFIQTI